ncbi:FG-GAP-like repeat-containing protein [Allorhodopirellula solitaria]|uniref:ASPIC and UnbV n=1 Tax=Allorhodopirellula solitaria TaxID=2527987 RepID=A0A5C5YG84_9BACT|nr:FG-GAP-like repeat-containing protein [Allorhodopirellula solitaria]TWT73979.1 ASPIC and UnbV [Allorhodopirellula solitaria]
MMAFKAPYISLLLVSGLAIAGCDRTPEEGRGTESGHARPAEVGASASSAVEAPSRGEFSLQEISDLIAQGDFQRADTVIRSMLSGDPSNAPVLFMAARSAHGQGKLDEAIESLKLIPPEHPEAGFPAMGQAADWLLDADRLAEAEVALEAMLDQYGDLAPVHRRLADLFNSQARRIESAEHVRALIRLGDVTEKELLSLTTLSVPYHDQLSDENEPTPASQNAPSSIDMRDLARAKEMLIQRNLEPASVLAQRLREQFPQSTAVAALEGRVYEALQRDDALRGWIASLPAGIEREPEYWTTLGTWMLRSGEPEPAIRAFCEAVQLDPTDRVAYLRLSEALAAVGEIDAAERVAARKTLLADAWQLALNVGLHRESRSGDMRLLAETLDQLGRPWEALSWRMVLAHESGRLEDAMPELIAAREALLQSDTEAAKSDRLCGVDPSNWRMPDRASLAGDSATMVASREIGIPPSQQRSIRLVDVAAQIGIDFRYHNNREPEAKRLRMFQVNGGGIAVLDYDRDGWMDFYFCDAGGRPNDAHDSYPNRLYRNLNGTATAEVALASQSDDRSYGQGVTAADLNQDGFTDLVVANIGENLLYINNGDGTFTRTVIDGSEAWTSGCVCGDLDGDALPEIVEINYIDDESAFTTECWGDGFDCSPRIFGACQDRLLKRNGQGDWVAMDSVAPSALKPNYGFAGIIANFDREHGNDVFVSNDTKDNFFWVSRTRDETTPYVIDNQAELRGCATGDLAQPQGCMGVTGGDFNRDGKLDFCVSNYWNEPSNLYIQGQRGFFTDSAAQFGIAAPSRETVGFGIQAVDLDRDGWLDLSVLNGHVFDPAENGTPEVPFRMLPQLFQGGPRGFTLVEPDHESDDPTASFWTTPTLGRTLVRTDFNRDGKPDLVANSLDSSVAVLANLTDTGHWLRLELVGTASERDAVGAEVVVTCGDQTFHQWRLAGGYMGANDPVIDIGLGASDRVDNMEIHWPSGNIQSFADVAADMHYLVIENDERLHVPK